jgi:conjugal transfer pilus assembly protein TraW
MSFSKTMILLLLAGTATAHAGHLGKIGPTYDIREADMLEWLEKRAREMDASGETERYYQEGRERIRRRLENLEPITLVRPTSTPRTFYFDPTLYVKQAIQSPDGKMVIPAGTRVNPLERVRLSKALVFFDGRDADQVIRAKQEYDRRGGLVKLILTAGSAFTLMEKLETTVYYDQKAVLVRRFGITQVPAIVQQEGLRLRIDEIRP